MQLINIKHPSEQVSFAEAVVRGLGSGQGLYFPRRFEILADVPGLLQLDFPTRSAAILNHLIGDEVSESTVQSMALSPMAWALTCMPALWNIAI